MANPPPFLTGEEPAVRRAAFSPERPGPRVRPAFSTEGAPLDDEPALDAQATAHAEAAAAVAERQQAYDAGVDYQGLDAGDDFADSGDLLDHGAPFADDDVSGPSMPSHAEAVQVAAAEAAEVAAEPPAAAPDVGPSIEAIVSALESMQASLTDEAKATALSLGLAIAKRIVGAALEADPAPLSAFIDEALAKVPAAAQVRLFLAPDDVERVEEIETSRWHSPGRKVTVVVDETLTAGDCRLEAPGIVMDGRLDTRVERLAAAARAAFAPQDDTP